MYNTTPQKSRGAGWKKLLAVISIAALGMWALLLPNTAQAETWTADPTFQRTPLRVTSENAYTVKVLSSGKVLTYSINGALMSGANGQRIGALVRMDPNTGAIDPTWHMDPTVLGLTFAGVAEAPDGKIYYGCALTGELANPADPSVNRIVRLNTDGSRDTSFNSPIFAYATRYLAVQPDGKIIACTGSTVLGVPQPGTIVQTVRLNTDGTLDPTFQSPNFQTYEMAPPASVVGGNYYDAGVFGNPVIDPTTGKIYFCGMFRFVNDEPRKGIVRCNADGTVDSTFVPTGLIGGTTQIVARAVVLQSDGKVVLGGTTLRTAAGGSTRYALLRFNDDGTLDSGFTLVPTTNSSGQPLFPGYFGPRDIAALPGGKILSCGIRVLRYLANGALDSAFAPLDYGSPNFNSGVDGFTIEAYRFSVNAKTGSAYLPTPGPLYALLGGAPVPGEITKLTPSGTIDPQFISPVVESEDFEPTVQLAASGAVYVSGRHTDFGSAANATITRLLSDGTRDAAYALDTLPFPDKQAIAFALLPDSSAYVVYKSGSVSGEYQFANLARLSPSGAIDTNFHLSQELQDALSINAFDGNDTSRYSLPPISPAPNGGVYIFPDPLATAQITVDTNGILKLVRVNPDGNENTSVPPLGFPVGEIVRDFSGYIDSGSSGYLTRLTQTADGGFIVLASVAPFPSSGGAPYNYRIIKLRADGSRDANFSSPTLVSTAPPDLSYPVLFDPVNGIVLQPPDGFFQESSTPVASASTFPDGSVLLTGHFLVNGNTYSLAKLTMTGALDASFNPPPAQNTARPARPAVITSGRVAPDGKVWVLGRFDTFGGSPAPGVARLNSNGTLDNTFQLTGVGYYDSFGDSADVVFADSNTAYLVGTFRHPGEPFPFAVTRIATPNVPATYSPLSPARVWDTRFGPGPTGQIGAGQMRNVTVTGVGGVPATGVTAVVLNIAAVNPTAQTFVTVWPTGESRPLAANLNVPPGDVRANLVIVKVGASGQVSVYNNSGSADFVADVAGWYGPGGSERYTAVSPARVWDSRTGPGPVGQIAAGQTRNVTVTGLAGVPATGVTAVVLNVAAVSPTARTFITAWPAGEAQPLAANLNVPAGDVRANLVIVKVGAEGQISFYNNSGNVNLVADVAGYFSATGSSLHSVSPSRIWDSRSGPGPVGQIAAGQMVNVTVTGLGGVPTTGVTAVVLNVAAVRPTARTFITAWPAGEAQPLAANLNVPTSDVRANLVTVKVGANGQVSFYNNSGNVDLVADVAGWYGPPGE